MSLRARILLLVLTATLLPVLAMTWLLLDNRLKAGSEARQAIVRQTHEIADELDDKIAGSAQLLFGLSHVPLLHANDKQACSDFLADVLRRHPQYTGILTIRPDGSLFCDSLRSGRKLNLTDRRYFQRALTAQEPVLEAAIGRLTGKSVLQIAYPVRAADGALQFILLASFDLDAYGQYVTNVLLYQNMHFQVWNGQGELILDKVRSNTPRLKPSAAELDFIKLTSSAVAADFGVGSQAYTWSKSALPNWNNAGLQIVLVVPSEDIDALINGPFRHTLSILIGLGTAVFILAVLFAEFALRRQSRRVVDAIATLDAGHYDQPLPTPFPGGEFGQVMQSLDRMRHSLKQQRETIARHTEALERQAGTDDLTELANRHLLMDRLNQAMVYARRAHRVTGVLMLDLDRFKNVNDSLGHSQGDLLLQSVAARLKECVREGDTVARLGGDEFVVVLSDMAEVNDIVPVAQKILSVLAKPISLGPQMLTVSASLGIAVYPRDGDTAESLLQYADTAMYRAKDQGGNVLAFFTQEMMQSILHRLQLEAGLRRALEQNELCLHYQPIIDGQSGRISSAEALVRWQDPERGLISPLQFIPIAEETGQIVEIGKWVVREACAQTLRWQQLGLGNIPVAVNLSARQFRNPMLDEDIAQILQECGCPSTLLQLEITESSIMDQVDQALATMHRLTALGVQLVIDDFGTGYSSLSLLKTFPVSKLKIDRSFVRDIGIDTDDDVLIDAIITLARKLGLRTVAEGVETEHQRSFLEKKGCDAYQGYLYGKPCASEAFVELLKLQAN